MKKLLKISTFILAFSGFAIVSADFLLNLYTNRNKVPFLTKVKSNIANNDDKDIEWAKKISKGGYLIFIRHATRDKKWDDAGYDLLETEVHNNGKNSSRFSENEYFANAVCLSKKGKVQARVMGEYFKNLDIPVGEIISSPICRARQTAELMFGKYDRLEKTFVYTNVFSQPKESRRKDLKTAFDKLSIEKDKNTIITAHGNVVLPNLFKNPNQNNLKVNQGGMIILAKENDELVVKHSYKQFNYFTKAAYSLD